MDRNELREAAERDPDITADEPRRREFAAKAFKGMDSLGTGDQRRDYLADLLFAKIEHGITPQPAEGSDFRDLVQAEIDEAGWDNAQGVSRVTKAAVLGRLSAVISGDTPEEPRGIRAITQNLQEKFAIKFPAAAV